MRQILVNTRTTEKRIAVLDGKKVLDFNLFRPTETVQPGQIYLAQIENIDRKIQACFVSLGNEKAFLHLDDIPEEAERHQGARLLVEVTRMGTKTKLPLVTGMIEISGETLVYIFGKSYFSVSKRIPDGRKKELIQSIKPHLEEAEAVILRSRAETSSAESILAELEEKRRFLADLRFQSRKRKKPGLLVDQKNLLTRQVERFKQHYGISEVVSDGAFALATRQSNSRTLFTDYGVEAELERCLKEFVHVDSGASLVIEKTEAMWVIDVNSGHFSTTSDKPETVFRVNQSVLPEIIRQLRLRQISGFIVIDFIGGMTETQHGKLEAEMEKLVQKELMTTQIAGFSKSGLMQLTRKKKEVSLLEQVTEICPSCGGTGHVKTAISVAYELERELSALKDVEQAVIIVTEAVLDQFLELETAFSIQVDWEIADEPVPFYQIRRIFS
ncbi:ribonuclease E/G [Listeria aquatica]|uniref:Ribonuclease E/G n=1 Tax=Listeria aquatica TaxID=1494960 RepID=A0A841ZJN8_9LIST|nr:ribonuclease E/G [Listeria aquatica]MBC1520899.1 ribonuclease E/G [Listeria aquatica]